MDELIIPKAFISYLYTNNFGNEDPTLDQIDDWASAQGFDKADFWRNYERMIKAKIVRLVQNNSTVRLSPKGTLQAEKLGLATSDAVARNREVRQRLMRAMAGYLSRCGATANLSDLTQGSTLQNDDYIGNLQLLIDMGYARWTVNRHQVSINPKVCAKAGTMSKVA
jgi:hypothetical protein